MVKLLMEYPPPYADISERECFKDYQRLKGIKWNDPSLNIDWNFNGETIISNKDSNLPGISEILLDYIWD